MTPPLLLPPACRVPDEAVFSGEEGWSETYHLCWLVQPHPNQRPSPNRFSTALPPPPSSHLPPPTALLPPPPTLPHMHCTIYNTDLDLSFDLPMTSEENNNVLSLPHPATAVPSALDCYQPGPMILVCPGDSSNTLSCDSWFLWQHKALRMYLMKDLCPVVPVVQKGEWERESDAAVMVMWWSCDGHVMVMWCHVMVMWWSCSSGHRDQYPRHLQWLASVEAENWQHCWRKVNVKY